MLRCREVVWLNLHTAQPTGRKIANPPPAPQRPTLDGGGGTTPGFFYFGHLFLFCKMCVFCKLFWFMSHFFCVSFLHGLCPPQHRPHTHNTPCTQLHSPTPSVKMKAMHWARITPTAISKTVWVADRLYCAATSRASFRLPCPPLRFKNQSRTKRHISYFPLCIIFFSGFFFNPNYNGKVV